jgi:hypothetical protein
VVNLSHKVTDVKNNLATVQLQLYSYQKIENLVIVNHSLANNKKVYLSEVESHTPNILPVSLETAGNEFYLTGRLTHAPSFLEPNVVHTLTYTLSITCPGRYVDKIEIQGIGLTPISSQSIISVTHDFEPNDSEKECLMIDHQSFGQEMVLDLRDKSELLITNWQMKPGFDRVYLSFEFQLKSTCYQLYQVIGYTGNKTQIPLYSETTVCPQKITAKIGHEFDARRKLIENKFNSVIRSVEFELVKRTCQTVDGPYPSASVPSTNCRCQCSRYYQVICELEVILSKLRILRLNIVNDVMSGRTVPSVYTSNASQSLCLYLKKTCFLRTKLDGNRFPTHYSLLVDSKVFFEREKVVAVDHNGFENSICCLSLCNCYYVRDAPTNTTYLMAVCQLERLLRDAICQMLRGNLGSP